MKETTNRANSKFRPVVLCAALSVLIDFILIPQILPRLPRVLRFLLLTDPVWMSLMIVIPVLVAFYMLEQKARIPAGYVWVGLLVQYLILIVFAEPISRIGSWGDWTYIWDAFIWPLSVTVAQFISLIALRAWKIKRGKNGNRAGSNPDRIRD